MFIPHQGFRDKQSPIACTTTRYTPYKILSPFFGWSASKVKGVKDAKEIIDIKPIRTEGEPLCISPNEPRIKQLNPKMNQHIARTNLFPSLFN